MLFWQGECELYHLHSFVGTDGSIMKNCNGNFPMHKMLFYSVFFLLDFLNVLYTI